MSADVPAADTRGLRARIIASARLSSLSFASTVVVRLVSTIVLTRLLTPDIYGVFAIVLTYIYLLEMFSDLGLRTLVLTYEETPDAHFLRTCWTVSILRGVLITTLSIIIGGVIWLLNDMGAFATGSAYAAPALPFAIAGIGIANFARSWQTPMQYMAEREMRFNRVTALRMTLVFANLPLTIVLAIALQSIWALVIASLLINLLQAVLSFLLFPNLRLRFNLDRANLRPIAERGKWIIGHSALLAMARSADQLVLGFILTSTTFGFYYIGRQIIDLVTTFLESMHLQMDMQVFKEMLRKPREMFQRDYYRYRLVFDAVSGLAAGGLVVAAPLVVRILYDDRYADVAPFMQLLAVGFLLTGPMLLRSVFNAERRFREMTFLSVTSTGTLWIGLAVTIFVLNSVTAALLVIALYRLPEVILLWRESVWRGWLQPLRETLPLVFMAVGAGLGFISLRVADLF